MVEFQQVVVLVTIDSLDAAQKIAGVLLERRRAACINIVPRVDSHYRWDGKFETDQEALMIIKTKASLMDELVDLVKEIHPYDVPEVIALPIVGGNQDYLEWIDRETEGK